jgi:KDO2-lipid IV(A) lauroyltransferase
VKLAAPADAYYASVIALTAAARVCPSRRARARFARLLGGAAYRFSRSKRRTIEAHVDHVLGGLDASRRDAIVREVFRTCWQEMLECSAPRLRPAELAETRFAGREHLDEALARGRGVILWESRGFGARLAAKNLLAVHGYRVHQVHGPNNLGGLLTSDASATWVRRALVRRYFDSLERRVTAEVLNLPADGTLAFTRRLAALLEQNAIVCITGDGQSGQRLQTVEFLGEEEPISTGMATLAELTGATLLPMFCSDEGTGPELVIEAPIEPDRALPREARVRATMQQFMRRLESWVRERPGQFRNWHLLRLPAPPRPASARNLTAEAAQRHRPNSPSGDRMALSRHPRGPR